MSTLSFCSPFRAWPKDEQKRNSSGRIWHWKTLRLSLNRLAKTLVTRPFHCWKPRIMRPFLVAVPLSSPLTLGRNLGLSTFSFAPDSRANLDLLLKPRKPLTSISLDGLFRSERSVFPLCMIYGLCILSCRCVPTLIVVP